MTTKILSSQLVGEFSRFKLDEFQTRFGTVEWIVTDAEDIDPATDLPVTIGQCDTKAEALAIIGELVAERVDGELVAERSQS